METVAPVDVLGVSPIVELAVDSILLHRKQAVDTKAAPHVLTSTSFAPQLHKLWHNISHWSRLPKPADSTYFVKLWKQKQSSTDFLGLLSGNTSWHSKY